MVGFCYRVRGLRGRPLQAMDVDLYNPPPDGLNLEKVMFKLVCHVA